MHTHDSDDELSLADGNTMTSARENRPDATK